ncbi:MAG: hypothetical protein RBT71_10800, partial [Flavobacteriales bacterium]|nr:hypothetical protein [Flavobacteriales bacterium]
MSTRHALIALIAGTLLSSAQAQTLTPEFVTAGYAVVDLGSAPGVPANYGGLTIRPEEPNTLYLGGAANGAGAALYAIDLVRDGDGHITGFSGTATAFVNTPNIDGGVLFAPNGTLLYTRYSMNMLGQVYGAGLTSSIALGPLGVAGSVGSVALVPQGFPAEGSLIVASYNSSNLYRLPYTIDVEGQYLPGTQNATVSVSGTASGPEGITYIPPGSAGFDVPSMAISSYSSGKVVVFDVDADGLPLPSSARDLVTGMSGAEGAMIDPVTGDFLFSTFGGGNRVILIKGFADPNDCAGVPFGQSIFDECGVCRLPDDPDFNSTCTDCAGVVNGEAFLDNCGDCVGGTTGEVACVQDCNGEWGGSAFLDNCGDCVGGTTGEVACVQDCNDEWGGEAFLDNCGDCVGGTTGEVACVQDCNGEWGGSAFLDNCGDCVGGTTGEVACVQDCNGEWGGTAFLDNCGDCVGGTTGEV